MFNDFFEEIFDFIENLCMKLIGIIICIISLPFTLLLWMVLGARWIYDCIKYVIKNKIWH